AIAAVLGAYIVLYPASRILAVWPSAAAVPAWVYLGIWFGYQLFEGNFALVHPDTTIGSRVAFFAHVSGFVCGALAAIALTRAGRIPSVPTTKREHDSETSDHPWWDRPLADISRSVANDPDAPRRTPSAPAAPRKFTNVGCPNCQHVQAVPK